MSDPAHLQVTVLVNEGTRRHHLPLYAEIVHLAHKHELSGASAFRGVEGFGHSHHVHTPHLFDFGGHLPVIVVIVDDEARVRAFLPALEELVRDDGVITVQAVEVLSQSTGR